MEVTLGILRHPVVAVRNCALPRWPSFFFSVILYRNRGGGNNLASVFGAGCRLFLAFNARGILISIREICTDVQPCSEGKRLRKMSVFAAKSVQLLD